MDADRYNTPQLTFIIIGDFGIGKTSLLLRFCDNTFQPTAPNLGLDAKERELVIDGQKVRLAIRDTAGQERFAGNTCSIFRGALGIILAYDITERTSFKSLVDNWIFEVRRYAGDKARMCVIGTKLDLAADRAVTESEAQDFANSLQRQGGGGGAGSGGMAGGGGSCIPYIETSAKTGQNVDELFTSLARTILRSRQAEKDSPTPAVSTLDLNQPPPKGPAPLGKKRCVV